MGSFLPKMLGGVVLIVFSTGGCAHRIQLSVVERVRPDQSLREGNCGYLYGNPPSSYSQRPTVPTRQVLECKLQLPPYADWSVSPQLSPAGQTVVPSGASPSVAVVAPAGPGHPSEAPAGRDEIPPNDTDRPTPHIIRHTVQEGETLGSLAKRYCGSVSRWEDIFELNRAQLDNNPDRIFPGQELRIPCFGEENPGQ